MFVKNKQLSSMSNIDTCLLCLDELSAPLQKPSSCNCNVYFHKKCMEEIQQNGLLCPICRIKGYTELGQNLLTQLPPFELFTGHPNPLTFLIFVVWCLLALCLACVILVGISMMLLTCFICIEIPYHFLRKSR